MIGNSRLYSVPIFTVNLAGDLPVVLDKHLQVTPLIRERLGLDHIGGRNIAQHERGDGIPVIGVGREGILRGHLVRNKNRGTMVVKKN